MKNLLQISTFLLMAGVTFGFDLPKITMTSPAFWATNVPSNANKVALTFDQPMNPGVTAWLGVSSRSPEVDLNSTVSADRTIFTMKVSLQPGKIYVFALNEQGIQGGGFQNDKGLSLPRTFLVFQTAGNLSANEIPPRIVRSIPGHGVQGIDSARLSGISLTFDQVMNPKKHGLHLYENNQLVDLSKTQFTYSGDGKTFTLPYHFKPATNYKLELNSTTDIGFTRSTRVPLWPAVIAFTTR